VKVLILGQGAREHALAWKFSRSTRISGLYVAPGNAGTDEIAHNLPHADPNNPQDVLEICHQHNIDMVFVGGEGPLSAGVSDMLESESIPSVGPKRLSARLESSKSFAKAFMQRHSIPTASAESFDDFHAFEQHIGSRAGRKTVVKKSGLAAGKGVLESADKAELLSFGKKVLKNDTLVVEEFLSGYEVSIFAVTDGTTYRLLPPCADYKKAGEGSSGPNTGGMGSVCPVPWLEQPLLDQIEREIVAPTFEAIHAEGLGFKGFLYFGLMITENGPRVLEYNVRLGDPEAQVLLPMIKSDFGSLCDAIVHGQLSDFPLVFSEKAALAVVVASQGYPGKYRKHLPVNELPEFKDNSTLLFHASTGRTNGVVHTEAGRCFTVVSIGKELLDARNGAYAAAGKVQFPGAWYRKDIGGKIFGN